jgi:ubiquitin C-terminal hydrolase
MPEQQSTTDRIYLYHQTKPFHSSQLQMKWNMLHNVGSGLNSTDELGICRNICYINGIIQCLAAAAPFVQWLLNEAIDVQCEYINCRGFST